MRDEVHPIRTLGITVLLLVAALGAGASLLAYHTQAGELATPQNQSAPGSGRGTGAVPEQRGADRPAPAVEPPAREPDNEDCPRPGDVIFIHALGTLQDFPIQGLFRVEPSGKVALGPRYGRVEVKGLTLEEAEEAIFKHLMTVVRNPKAVSVTRLGPDSDEALERRVKQLEKEVRALRTLVEESRKKPRD